MIPATSSLDQLSMALPLILGLVVQPRRPRASKISALNEHSNNDDTVQTLGETNTGRSPELRPCLQHTWSIPMLVRFAVRIHLGVPA